MMEYFPSNKKTYQYRKPIYLFIAPDETEKKPKKHIQKAHPNEHIHTNTQRPNQIDE